MDRMMYVAMTGAKQNMLAQAVNSNNLANVSTDGFKADLAAARSIPLFGNGFATRVFSMTEKAGTDFTPGTVVTTGRELDVAINGKGWFVVQTEDGKQALTRAGSFHSNVNGELVTRRGDKVLGTNGAISIPPASKIEINNDGTISLVPIGDSASQIVILDRLKLVNPNEQKLLKGTDGLFRLNDNGKYVADASVSVISGTLENSNVNAIEAMVNMIDLARQFEMQIKMMRLAEKTDEQTAQMMRLA